tara:strand:- start:136 stop:729 length:594 start_codon:yes stop_codon:yes gene_type:complete
MHPLPTFDLSKKATRIWDLEVPVLIDKKNNVIEAYLTNTIEEPFMYNELCYLIKNANKDTTINLNINTPGGIIDSAFMIANAISDSKANVVGILTGTVASAGTLIAMACSSLAVSPHVSFMIHNYSGGMAGKGHEMKARQKFTDDHLNEAFTSFYSGFLSKDEMEKVIEGTDIWMTTPEVNTRWEQRVAYVKGKAND